MKTQHIVSVAAIAAFLASGCQTPVPAKPIAVQPAPLPAVSLAAPSAPTAVSGVEVRVAPTAPAANKTRALLIVQQHGGSANTGLSLQQLGDWLAAALGADAFSVVNPHDVIGTTQNVGPWGEKMPEASATELAAKIGTPILLTASVTDVRVRHIGGTDPGVQAVLEFTLSAKAVPGGDLLTSVNATARGKKASGEIAFRENAANNWSEVAKAGAYGAAAELRKEWEKLGPQPGPAAAPVRALFSANVPGAVVRIDGVAYGTLGSDPLAVFIAPGLHNVEVAYPGMDPFRELAMFQEGTSFAVALALTAEGRKAYLEDEYFRVLCERIQKGGLTDDLVRELTARGYAKFLESSHVQFEGMPQTFAPVTVH